MPNTRRTNLLLLSVIELLERFSFYGMRAIIVLFAIDEAGLNLDNREALGYYGFFTLLVYLIPLPAGLISDFTFKQKNGVLLGGLIALVGYSLLMFLNFQAVAIGVILIAIGTSFVKPNLTVLVGRLYSKKEKRRDIGFMVYYLAINVGAFLSALTIGYVGEKYGWNFGFGIAAVATLFYLSLFYFLKNRLQLVEEKISQNFVEYDKKMDSILDAELTLNNLDAERVEKNTPPKNSILLFLIITLTTVLFWGIYDVINGYHFNILSSQQDLNLFGFEIYTSLSYSIPSVLSIILTLVFAIIWYFNGLGSTLFKIGFSMFLMGIACVLIIQLDNIPKQHLMNYSLFPFFILAIAEVFISPIATSYITRLSDIRYSSSIIGFYFCITGLAGKWFGTFSESMDKLSLISALLVVAFIVGSALIFLRKKLLHLSGGLD